MAELPPEAAAYQRSHIDEDESQELGAYYIACIAASFVCMVSKITSRRVARVGLKSDDFAFLVGATIAEGSFIVLMIYAFRAGLGKHWLALRLDQKVLFPKLNYAYNILNVLCYPIIKISILLLYYRIFGSNRRFRLIVWGCVAFITAIGVSTTLVAIFACRPVQGFYDFSVPSRCINAVSFYWAQAVLNIITDAIILVLPLPMVWRLQTTLRRKIAISLLFMLGGLTFTLSIVRVFNYLQYDANDPSYSFIGSAYSTPGEVTMAIVCAAAPTWRPLSRRLTEIARSRWSSIRSSGRDYDVEVKGQSSSHKSSQGGHSEHDHNHIELPSLPPIPQSTQHTVYDARLTGANQSHAEAYRDPLASGRPFEENYGISNGQNRGIQVQREVTVEDDRNRS